MISAYDELYLGRARTTLGNMLDFAVNELECDTDEFWNRFVKTSVSEKFARGEVSVVAGKSGAELAYDVLGDYCSERKSPEARFEKSPEYWAGWALCYYSWKTVTTFAYIQQNVPIKTVLSMYFPYHEMDIGHFCDRLDELIKENQKETNLKRIRRMRGMTQKELADETEIPIRTIQQYEQGQKKINGARAEYIVALSRILYCKPEELLEKEA